MFGEYICSVLDLKVRGSSILVETNLFLAIKLQSDFIIRAILYVASILKIKIKVEIGPKILVRNTTLG